MLILLIISLSISCQADNKTIQFMTNNSVEFDMPPNEINKPNYILDFNDEFDINDLNFEIWIPYYLPQWSSKENSKPIFHFDNGNIVLRITKEQKPWCPEFNGEVKVSSIQTGLFSGKLGTNLGQHRFNPLCIVREEQEKIKKYTPKLGYFEIRAKADITESNVVSLWMIGFEDSPEKSGEICIFEIKGKNVTENSAIIGYGIHPFGDRNLKDEFYEEKYDIDVTKYHIYAAEWTSEKVDFFIDNKKIKTIKQSPNYPMQFMLSIYEVPMDKEKTGNDKIFPKEFIVDYIRAYRQKKKQ